ncbi:hypothetical protein DL93DRAFT_2227143 [Clavulina sp. PMI_390]|nr:hypothetical protein DL93DRAFT_2227143 [Clavulina sp. PMI_390]
MVSIRQEFSSTSVVVDSWSTTASGFSGPEVFDSLLYTSGNLTRGSHQVHLSNTPNDTVEICVDIDWIEIDDEDSPSETGSLYSVPSDKAFQLLPSADTWQNVNGVWQTNNSQASATFTFTGGSAAIYGRLDVPNGGYVCSIDHGPASRYSSYSPQLAVEQTLCYAGGLDPTKQHTIQLISNSNSTNPQLQLTHAQAWQMGEKASSKLSSGAIAGISIGAIAFLLILGTAFVVILRRRRQRQHTVIPAPSSAPDSSNDLGLDKPSSDPFPNFPRSPAQFDSSSGYPTATGSQAPSSDASTDMLSPLQPPVLSYMPGPGSRLGDPMGLAPPSRPQAPSTVSFPPTVNTLAMRSRSSYGPSTHLSPISFIQNPPTPLSSTNATYRGSMATPNPAYFPGIHAMTMAMDSLQPGLSATGGISRSSTFTARHDMDAGLLMTDTDLGVLEDDARSLAPPGYLSRATSPGIVSPSVYTATPSPLRPIQTPEPRLTRPEDTGESEQASTIG